MSTIGMNGAALFALSVASTVLPYQPSLASDALLAKAQAEFTAKARDAVLQRRAAQAPTGMVLASVPRDEPEKTHAAPSLEPASLSSPPAPETSESRSIPARTVTAPAITPVVQPVAAPLQSTVASDVVVQAPVVVAKNVDASVGPEFKADEIRPQSIPVAAETAVDRPSAPKQSELPQTAAPQAASQVVAPQTNKLTPTTVKTTKPISQPVRTVSAKTGKTARRFEREFSVGRLPYDIETLRAHAPEIAAAIARYM